MKKLFMSFLTSLIILFSLAPYSHTAAACGSSGAACGRKEDPSCCSGLTCDKEGLCSNISASTSIYCNGKEGIQTAIGCIPVLSGTNGFLGFILKWAVGIGGGIAFLLMIYAGFMVMTAADNPERLKAGQELLTSAISGLILLIFSVFILKFIGVDILGLCNLGFKVIGSCP